MSISQRLALAFGFLLVVLAGFAVLVHSAHRSAELEYHTYLGTTEQLVENARALERSLLFAAISLRSYLAFPNSDYRNRLDAAIGAVRRTMDTVMAQNMDYDDRDLIQRIDNQLENYLRESTEFASSRLAGLEAIDAERRMTLAREQLLAKMRQLTSAYEQRTRQHLAAVDQSLRRSTDQIVLLSISALILFAAFGLIVSRSIRIPLKRLVEVVNQARLGNHGPALELADIKPGGRDEIKILSRAFGEAASAIRQRERRMEADASLCRDMVSNVDADRLGSSALTHLVGYVDGLAALLYRWDDGNGVLTALVGHAVPVPEQSLEAGDGLPGQAARQRTRVLIQDIPTPSPLTVKLGYDQVTPTHAVAQPILHGDNLLGVFVIASLHPFSQEQLEYLESAATLLAIGLRNGFAHERIVNLLDEVNQRNVDLQRAHEDLQVQNEEIQAQHEELQAQNEEIQAQNEEIQSQHEELRSKNHQLLETTESLRARTDEVEAANQRKTDFLAVLAHELRNPMAPIMTSLALLRRVVPKNDDTETPLRALERQSAHLTRLIEDLLDLTRISRGKIELQRQPTNMASLVEECVHDYRDAIEAKGLNLQVHKHVIQPMANVDPDRIVQAIGNLLHNATKFTPEGGHVSVELDQRPGEVLIAVSDTGPGMDAELMARLFRPFSQGPGGLDRKFGGLGLGLALVKGLVEQHGGRIAAHSSGVGTGSRFTIVLPLLDDAPALRDGTWPIPEPATRKAPANRRILIVDDNIDAANTLRLALGWEGYEVEMVHEGTDVEAAVERFQPEIILCDIGLPGMDGYQVAARLRANPAYDRILMIAVTGYASDSDRERSRQAGFDAHLAKPVDFNRLVQSLRELKPGQRNLTL